MNKLQEPKDDDRIVILDVETTGISYEEGHKVIEIGAIELINRCKTGRVLHKYIYPERAIDEGAFRVHGLDLDILKEESGGKTFKDIASEFWSFVVGDNPNNKTTVVAHNSKFDMGHLDAECRRIGIDELSKHVKVSDSLQIAISLFPKSRNNLDALARRFNVDTTARTLHGALLDAEILVDVYLAMTTVQHELITQRSNSKQVNIKNSGLDKIEFTPISSNLSSKLRATAQTQNDVIEHNSMMKRIEDKYGENVFVF